MPNIKSAIKRVELTKASTARNRVVKSNLRSNIKKFDLAVAEGKLDHAGSAYKAAVKSIDKAVGRGVLHKNTAARKKSSLTRKLNSIA